MAEKTADSFNLADNIIPIARHIIIITKGLVIEPVSTDLKLSIPKIIAIPEICPDRSRNPFEVPSETG